MFFQEEHAYNCVAWEIVYPQCLLHVLTYFHPFFVAFILVAYTFFFSLTVLYVAKAFERIEFPFGCVAAVLRDISVYFFPFFFLFYTPCVLSVIQALLR